MISDNTQKRLKHALASNVIELGEATTGTTGIVEVEGLKADGIVFVLPSEDPGAALVISDVVVAKGQFTVYTKNTGTDARAALNGKKVFYLLLKK